MPETEQPKPIPVPKSDDPKLEKAGHGGGAERGPESGTVPQKSWEDRKDK